MTAGIVILSLIAPPAAAAEYDSKAPLYIKRVEFCLDKPKGAGAFNSRENNEFKKGDDEVYIYIEAQNCRPEKEGQYYHIRLAMDIDIYYEDGMRIYSEEGASAFDHQSIRRNTDSYLWAKIDASCLREGEYKVEITVRDENSDKEAFALTRFKRL